MSRLNFKRLIPRKRRNKIMVGAALLALIPAIAWAAYLFHLGVGGSVKAGQFAWTYNTAAPTISGTGASDICASASVSGNVLTINPGSGALPGDECKISTTVYANSSNTTTGEIAGLTMPNLPTGWTASIPQCGAQVAAGASTNVVLDIQVGSNANLNGSTVSLSGSSIDIAVASQAPANPSCTVTGGGQ